MGRLNETAVKNPRPISKWQLEVNVKGTDIPVLLRKTDKSYRYRTDVVSIVQIFPDKDHYKIVARLYTAKGLNTPT